MRNWMWAALATGCLWAGGGVASASDIVRLGGPSAQTDIQGGTDTELVQWRRHHHHHHHGHYRPYYGGYHHHARPYYSSNYYYPRSYSHYSYGYGNYGSSYSYHHQNYYHQNYYRPYYSRPSYGGSFYFRIAGETDSAPALTLQTSKAYQAPLPQQYAPVPNGGGTYQYNGGPDSPIPMPTPGQDANPAQGPRGIIPLDGRLVSMPDQATGSASPVGLLPMQPRGNATTTTPRVSYPAYGEN